MTTEEHDATFYQFTPPPPPPPTGPQHDTRLGNPPRRHRSAVTKTAAGLALVLGAGAGAGAVAMTTASGGAATLTSTTASTTSASTTSARPARKFSKGGLSGAADASGARARFRIAGPVAFPGAGAGGIVHGSFTVQGPNGSYETLDTQVGTVEAVSANSITLKSADGYSQRYSVAATTVVFAEHDGISSVNTGDEVTVVGLVRASGVTAERIVDVTQLQANGGNWELPGPNFPNGNGPGSDGPGSAA